MASMKKNVRRLTARLLSGAMIACLLTAAAFAAPLSVHKVARVPVLRPLTVSTGGRMLVLPAPAAADFGARDYMSQWPGSYFRAAFEGNTVFFRIVKGEEILHIVVDGRSGISLVKPEPGVYEVEDLSRAKHRISVFVATESQAAPNTFGGFAIPAGETGLSVPRRHRQIEFIGDSHTVGYGDLSTRRECTRDQVWSDTDDTSAFGPMTARHFDADYQVNAISGRGVVRNYNGFPADTLPQAYPYVLFNKAQKYEDPSWKPQVVVIALGTNDFSTPLRAGERWETRDALHADFEATYLRFLESLRAHNPRSLFIVWATDMANGEIEAEAQKVVGEMKKQGDRHIDFLPIDGLSFTACDSHPSLADHKVISDDLVRLIDADKQVWLNR